MPQEASARRGRTHGIILVSLSCLGEAGLNKAKKSTVRTDRPMESVKLPAYIRRHLPFSIVPKRMVVTLAVKLTLVPSSTHGYTESTHVLVTTSLTEVLTFRCLLQALQGSRLWMSPACAIGSHDVS